MKVRIVDDIDINWTVLRVAFGADGHTSDGSEALQILVREKIDAVARHIIDVVKDAGSRGKLTVRTRLDGDAVDISIGNNGTGILEAAPRAMRLK